MVERPAVGIRQLLSICLVLPACFNPHYDRPTCDPVGRCPDGLTCRGGFCESGSSPDDASIDGSVGTASDAPPDVAIDAPPDVAIDAPPDAQACFGSFWTICLQSAPSVPFTIGAAIVINTDNSPLCSPVMSGGNLCVLTGTTISITAALRATGTRPLVLIASGSLTIGAAGSIDVGSHRGATPETGANSDPATCAAGTAPGTRAGGAGGSFTGPGGNGGNGGGGGGSGGQRGNPTAGPVTQMRGGCAGQDGDGSNRGVRGHGGGAVLLIAASIDHTGAVNAAGEGGTAGIDNLSGGGGGGAGGMIVLDAPTIIGNGLLLANGGGGGEGSGQNSAGDNGDDPIGTGAALGGNGGSTSGGNGGNGSAGAAGGGGASGADGANAPTPGGGGAGGGGAGLIRARTGQNVGPNVSPAVTPF